MRTLKTFNFKNNIKIGRSKKHLSFRTTNGKHPVIRAKTEMLFVLLFTLTILGIQKNAEFLLLQSHNDLENLNDTDVLFSGGSLHHAPREFLEPEYRILESKIRTGGRWLQLAYPKTRWVREGSPKFEKWGTYTDGPDTPYAKPIDAAFVQSMIEPRESRVILDYELHNSDFNWIDLELL